jgi:hypothetical protein
MTATRAFALAFNERALIPTDNYDWNWYQSRLFRYALAESYYNNIAYRNIVTFSARLKANSDLYKHIRSVYNPVYRLVEAYTAKVYGGALDFEDLSRGAIPVTMASDELKAAISKLWIWSNWGVQKSLYPRTGSQLGDVFIKTVDEPDKEKVRMEVLHPGKVKEAEFDAVGNVKTATIEYDRCETDGKTWYLYTEKIDQESFSFYKNGKPWDYLDNRPGGANSQYDNIYGFVPLVHTKHKDVGQTWGANAFHAQLGKIDELNDSASLLNDQVRKAVNVMWYFAGVKSKTEVNASTDEKDKMPAIYGPEGSQPFPMIANVDITAAGINIERLQTELERDLPELALHRLREGGNVTAPGVRASYSDAIDHFTEAQGTYDDGLIRAHKMAVTIGGMRGYEGFQGFGLDSYDNGDLDHYINERPIIQDQLSKLEKVQTLQGAQAPIWLIMRELDYDEETIEEVIAEKEKNLRDAMRGFAEGTFGDEENATENGDTTQADQTQQAQDTQQTQADARPAIAA